MIEFRLLGSVDLKGSEGETLRSVLAQPKRVALLAYLAVARPDGYHRRDKLLGLFWPESDQEHGRGALRKALYFLRQSLGEEVIVSRGDEEIALAEDALWCDAVAFEAALEAGQPEEALELYRGDLLEGFFIAEAPEFERWLESERERLRSRASEAAWRLAEREEAQGTGAHAASWARKAVSLSPDDEGGFRRLLELLDRVGDRAGAMKEYEAFARRLNEEYEGEPSPETQALIAAIRERDVAAHGDVKAVERPAAEVPAEQAAVLTPPAPRPTGLKGLVTEVHRRSLWQVLLIYTGGALVAYQAVQALTEGLGLPDWFPGMAIVLFVVLLPVVLATAFVQEGGPPLTRQKPAPVPQAVAPAAVEEPRARGVLTWRNSIVGGVLAFVLLGVAVSGYMGVRVMGIGPWGTLIGKGVLEERDVIVLAEFEDRTNDNLALTVTEALRVDLGQSLAVRVAGRDYVSRVLERMEKDPDAELTYDLAREVAIREGLKAVVSGEISMLGSSYLLSVRLVAAETGEELYSLRETAEGLDPIIAAIDRLSKKLRERVGESLRAVRSSPPLSQARTASLEALRLLTEASQANGRGDRDEALDLVNRAIEIDAAFAEAYRLRSIVLASMLIGRTQRIADATRAYELRHRLPLWERYWIESRYHSAVTGDRGKQIEAYRAVLKLKPDHSGAWHNLGAAYRSLRDYSRAEDAYRHALEVGDSLRGTAWAALAGSVFNQGKFEEAWETLRQWEVKLPDDPRIPRYRAYFASAQGDYDPAEEAYVRSDLSLQGRLASYMLGRLAQVQGRVAEAERHQRELIRIVEQMGTVDAYWGQTIELSRWYQDVRSAPHRALEEVEAGLQRHPLSELEPLDRPYHAIARLYAAAGRLDRAKELIADYEAEVDPALRRTSEHYRHLALGEVSLAEGRPRDAIEEFQAFFEQNANPIGGLNYLGQAYEMAGEPDSAIIFYERSIATPSYNRLFFDARHLAYIYERLGDLYEQRGDTVKAIYYYGKLVELWRHADPELQPRVEAARRAIEALSPDT